MSDLGVIMTLPLLAQAGAAQVEQPVEAIPPEVQAEPDAPPEVDNQVIDGRRRPDYTGPLPDEIVIRTTLARCARLRPRRSQRTRCRSLIAGG